MNRDQWLADRRGGLGGSDAAAILGVSRYKTPVSVWQEKRGIAPAQADNERMLWGRLLEPVIRQEYANRTGRIVRVPVNIMGHDVHPFMLASFDGLTDDRRVFEAKTARTREGWGDEGTDEIPPEYLIQTQHYLCVSGYEVADVAVLIGGSDFRMYEVPADRELQDMLIEAEDAFWQLVQSAKEPDPVNLEDVRRLYGHAAVAGAVQANPEILLTLDALRDVRAAQEVLKAEEEQHLLLIQSAMGERDTLADGDAILATWKLAKGRAGFDAARLKADDPATYAKYAKAGEPSRRFLLKGEA